MMSKPWFYVLLTFTFLGGVAIYNFVNEPMGCWICVLCLAWAFGGLVFSS